MFLDVNPLFSFWGRFAPTADISRLLLAALRFGRSFGEVREDSGKVRKSCIRLSLLRLIF